MVPGKDHLESLLKPKPVANRVRLFPFSRYEEALQRYLAQLPPSRHGALSIYRFGNWETAGLSDIDLLVIFPESSRDYYHRYSISKLPADDRYIFSHDPLLISRRDFSDIQMWFPVTAVSHVQGSTLPEPLPHLDAPDVKLLHLFKMLITFQFPLLSRYSFFGDNFDERISENVAKGLCNSIKLWLGAQRPDPEGRYEEFVSAYQAFRRSWFELESTKREAKLRGFVAESLLVTADLLEDSDRVLRESWFPGDPAKDAKIVINGDTYEFSAEWTKEKCIERFIGHSGFYFPLGFLSLLRAFSDEDGSVGAHLRQLGIKSRGLAVAEEKHQLLKKHMDALEGHNHFFSEKFRMTPFPFPSFWAPFTRNRWKRLYYRVSNKLHKALL